ncbi:hypothetical protein [Pontibacter virosus]|uniref:PH (Pleckstrin Homology) domain-containing protein n=1 Tax=Pontibacter virosus TaxID=1765052 RepID=A0A2U1B608_9BACT|nr:hypothetical protein [Pontibacter virosus]PVY44078.1 hypothetical protein C8E01_101442 [Pontibacter virosus]
MAATSHSYNTGHYFSASARAFGWITTALAITMIINGSVAAYAFLPTAIVTQLTHYRTEFDLANRTYREGVRFAGITFGKMLPLAGIDFLYLKKKNYKQVSESRASMSVFQFVKYDGYIKLSDNVKLHLLQRKTKELAMQEMQQIAQDLQAELRDLTEMELRG